ncbi:unnamed protein product [Caenorhabditis nigoni]
MSSNQSLQNELNGVGSGNDSPSTVEEWKKAFEAKDQELLEAKKEIAELKRKYKQLDEEFLERVEQRVGETNFNYGNQIVDLKWKNTELELVAKKYEELKKELEDGKQKQPKLLTKDHESLMFFLEMRLHQSEEKVKDLSNELKTAKILLTNSHDFLDQLQEAEQKIGKLEVSNQNLRNVIESCYETITSAALKSTISKKKQDGELAKLREKINGYQFDATVFRDLIEELEQEQDELVEENEELLVKNEDLKFHMAIRDEEEAMMQIEESDQDLHLETDQAPSSSNSGKRKITKNEDDNAKKLRK